MHLNFPITLIFIQARVVSRSLGSRHATGSASCYDAIKINPRRRVKRGVIVSDGSAPRMATHSPFVSLLKNAINLDSTIPYGGPLTEPVDRLRRSIGNRLTSPWSASPAARLTFNESCRHLTTPGRVFFAGFGFAPARSLKSTVRLAAAPSAGNAAVRTIHQRARHRKPPMAAIARAALAGIPSSINFFMIAVPS